MEKSERIVIERRLREKGLEDSDIAGVLGISRELVGQDLGRRRDDLVVTSGVRQLETIVRTFIPEGFSYAELKRKHDVSVWTLRTTLARLGMDYNDHAGARFKRRRTQLKKTLLAFLATRRPFTATEIGRFNPTLLHQLYSIMSLSEWKKEMGVADDTTKPKTRGLGARRTK